MADRRLMMQGRHQASRKDKPMFVFQHVYAPQSLVDKDENDEPVVLDLQVLIDGIDFENNATDETIPDDMIEEVEKTGMFNGKIVYVANDKHLEVEGVWGVCGTCNGNGTHVNPSIDRNGLTREDFDEDPDFRESYLRGDYNVECYECKGLRVTATIYGADGKLLPHLLHLERFVKMEQEGAREDWNDRRTRWMEEGCPRDFGPEDYG